MKYKDIPSIADIAIKIDFVAMCHDTPEHSKAWLRNYAEWLRIHHNTVKEYKAEYAKIAERNETEANQLRTENEKLRGLLGEVVYSDDTDKPDDEFWRLMERCRRELK